MHANIKTFVRGLPVRDDAIGYKYGLQGLAKAMGMTPNDAHSVGGAYLTQLSKGQLLSWILSKSEAEIVAGCRKAEGGDGGASKGSVDHSSQTEEADNNGKAEGPGSGQGGGNQDDGNQDGQGDGKEPNDQLTGSEMLKILLGDQADKVGGKPDGGDGDDKGGDPKDPNALDDDLQSFSDLLDLSARNADKEAEERKQSLGSLGDPFAALALAIAKAQSIKTVNGAIAYLGRTGYLHAKDSGGSGGSTTTTLNVKVNGQPTGKVSGRAHKSLPDIIRAVSAGIPTYLVGPPGSGKTTIARQVAQALGVRLAKVAGSEDATEGDILGSERPSADGSWRFKPRIALRAFSGMAPYEDGALLFLDEADNLRPGAVVACHALFDGSDEIILGDDQDGNPLTFHRSDRFYSLAAGNTFGGLDSEAAFQRQPQDKATLSRFQNGLFYIGYDESLERQIGDPRAVALVHAVRKIAKDRGWFTVFASTRDVVNATTLLAAGSSINTILDSLMLSMEEDQREFLRKDPQIKTLATA